MKLKKNYNLSLDKFINLSLYNKKFGYYMKKNPFGKEGDFITAPNISRLFSEMIAIWIISFWESLGAPKKFNLIELGAGNGEMMKILIESFQSFPVFLKSCNFIIHEKSPSLINIQKKKLHKTKIIWISKINKIKKNPSIFIANEFFDALAIKQLRKKENFWLEKFVNLENINKAFFFEKKADIKKIEKKINFKISHNQNFIEYNVNYQCKIILPTTDDIFNAKVDNITHMGVVAYLDYKSTESIKESPILFIILRIIDFEVIKLIGSNVSKLIAKEGIPKKEPSIAAETVPE